MMGQIRDCACVDFRDARSGDLPEVLVLLRKADLPSAGVPETLSDFFVAEQDGRLVGVAGLEIYRSSALLRSVVVEDEWRGSGVGGRLIDLALEKARARGLEDVFLLTTTAQHYFPRFGFACVTREAVSQEVRASVEFQGACPASAVVMRRYLAE
jgi:amino-acid N-acetyltransferase